MMEKTLHSLRVPTSSEVDALRHQLRRMGDQVEALGSELEHVVELLERQEQSPPHRLRGPPGLRSRARRRRATPVR